MKKLFLMSIILAMTCLLGGCFVTDIVDSVKARVDTYLNEDGNAQDVYDGTSAILAEFKDTPPKSTADAAMRVAALKAGKNNLSPGAKAALGHVYKFVLPIVNTFVAATGISDEGRVARLIGKAIRIVNDRAKAKLPQTTMIRTGDDGLIVCSGCQWPNGDGLMDRASPVFA